MHMRIEGHASFSFYFTLRYYDPGIPNAKLRLVFIIKKDISPNPNPNPGHIQFHFHPRFQYNYDHDYNIREVNKSE